jgi:transcriptional regulator with XRE-family HTH domain
MKEKELKFYKEYGSLLRRVRRSLNLSQDDFSKCLGLNISKVSMSEIERGKRGISLYQATLIESYLNDRKKEIVEIQEELIDDYERSIGGDGLQINLLGM